jgi:5-methylcytosine-specific restriction protein A
MRDDWIHIEKDPKHMAREKIKAQKLQRTQWWKKKTAAGICHYCRRRFAPDELTMDHIVPLSRGGKSNKGNVVPSCRECNYKKKYYTPAEILMKKLHNEPDKDPPPV